MNNHRLLYKKEGKAAYISHLDLMRTFQRTFLRAGLMVRHTEGFNPHAYISVALPLSVGQESRCELLDFDLVSDCRLSQVPMKLNAVLPEGIVVLECYEAVGKCKQIAWLEIEGILEYDKGADEITLRALTDFFARESIIITKKGKKGMREMDISPGISRIAFSLSREGNVSMQAVLAAQNPSINPEMLISALRQPEESLAPDFAAFRRINTLDSDFGQFR